MIRSVGRLLGKACVAGVVLGGMASPVAAGGSSPAPGPRPNIVFILADDLGYGDLGSYGQQRIQTPHLDRLAAEGLRFTQAYAGSTVCAPSRSSLMTGMHNGHNRVRDNLPHDVWLRPDDFTVAEMLKQAGYRTGGIGKWSLGNPGSWGIPLFQGFDHWYGHLNQDQAHFYYPDYLWDDEKVALLQKVVMVGDVGKMQGNRGGRNAFYTHDLFTERALAFVDDNRDHPFFLYLAYTIPHFSDYPKDTPELFIVPSDAPYTDRDWPPIAKNYAAMITRLDRDVGRLVERLGDLGLAGNTLVIFTSDNGPYQGVPTPIEFFDSNGPLRGGKRDVYEGGVRVPFIARWPGKVPAGETSDQVLTFWDMMPTFADLLNLPTPEGIDGISVLPALLGRAQPEHEYLYFDYGHVRRTYKQAVRLGDWKGVRNGARAPIELYDLRSDLGETTDVASEHPGVTARIRELMDTSRTDVPEYAIRELAEEREP